MCKCDDNKCPCCGAPVKKCKKCGDVEYEPPARKYIPWYPYPYSPYYPRVPSIWIDDGGSPPATITYSNHTEYKI